ncbi:MAG: SpoIID/LytB domain-containing protein, partial [Clostridia bacterium]|nr:SpoIID/LytB domain-containing protein [Clostridia bacterium]
MPVITIFDTAAEAYEEVNIEDYVAGVLAGEMRNDWPMEALKAQAILARTFVLKFIGEKESKYPGAQISTDISEAQAYAPDAVNDRVRKAVDETRGLVLSANGELPYAWFHAHSGGMTELPVE